MHCLPARFLLLSLVASCGRLGFAPSAAEEAGGESLPQALLDGDPGCPNARGPMTQVAGGFCIDDTEVTKAQYAQFLLALVPVKQDARCAFNTTYQPASYVWNATTEMQQAVAGVDWCDARDYCDWAGKRLCGRVGGGSLDYGEATAVDSQWYQACSQGRALSHPYGSVIDDAPREGYCYLDETDTTTGKQAIVASFPRCVLAGTQVYDLLGNVQEWVDACEQGTDPANMHCKAVSAPWYFSTSYADCDFVDPTMFRPDLQSKAVGFRCCAD